MNIEKSLALAVEGGYELKRSDRTSLNEQMAYLSINPDQVLLDPLFWQALGKSMGWGKPIIRYGYNLDEEGAVEYTQRWRNEWHHFIDSLAEGKTVEEAMGIIYENPELKTNL